MSDSMVTMKLYEYEGIYNKVRILESKNEALQNEIDKFRQLLIAIEDMKRLFLKEEEK